MLEKHQLKEILDLCVETGGDFAEIFEEKKVCYYGWNECFLLCVVTQVGVYC